MNERLADAVERLTRRKYVDVEGNRLSSGGKPLLK